MGAVSFWPRPPRMLQTRTARTPSSWRPDRFLLLRSRLRLLPSFLHSHSPQKAVFHHSVVALVTGVFVQIFRFTINGIIPAPERREFPGCCPRRRIVDSDVV